MSAFREAMKLNVGDLFQYRDVVYRKTRHVDDNGNIKAVSCGRIDGCTLFITSTGEEESFNGSELVTIFDQMVSVC